MTSGQLIALAIVVIIAAIVLASKNRHRIKRVMLDWLNINPAAWQRKSHEPEQVFGESVPKVMSAEESEAELLRLQRLIEGRKQVAWNTDIAHHLWDLYKNLLPYANPHSLDHYIQDGEWYDVKVLHVSTKDGVNQFEFELKGARYKFVDDEEKQGWRSLTKIFSLFLYDESGRCLIEVPMRMKVDSEGRHYAVLSGGPNAFLLGGWINDFINVKLKHQRLRNQEIRAQRHRERLAEIEELKSKFGIVD